MKKTTRIDDLDDDLKPEYDFDDLKSKPNKKDKCPTLFFKM